MTTAAFNHALDKELQQIRNNVEKIAVEREKLWNQFDSGFDSGELNDSELCIILKQIEQLNKNIMNEYNTPFFLEI